MSWYWLLFIVLVAFNLGFVCGAWLGGSTTRRLVEIRDAEFEDLQVREVSV